MNVRKVNKNIMCSIGIMTALGSIAVSGMLRAIFIAIGVAMVGISSFITWDTYNAEYSVRWALKSVEDRYEVKDVSRQVR